MKPKTRKRRPYAAPAVKSERLFERASLVCGQKPGQRTSGCRTRPNT